MGRDSRPRRSAGAISVVFAVLVAACGGSAPESPEAPLTTQAQGETTVPAAGVGPLEVTISSTGGPAQGPIPLTVRVANRTDANVVVVRPIAIPNFVSLRIFDASGARMGFLGPHYRFAPFDDSGFAELEPGQEIKHVFDLSVGYRLEPGTYRVTAEYVNPSGGSHEGTRALVFEPGEGPVSQEILLEVTP